MKKKQRGAGLAHCRVQIAPAVLEDLRSAHRAAQKEIVEAINALPFCPRPRGIEKLGGRPDLFRKRVGDYWVAYAMLGKDLVVVCMVMHCDAKFHALRLVGARMSRILMDNAASNVSPNCGSRTLKLSA